MTEFDKVIPPGGVGKVTVSLDTSHYRGSIAKSVRVTTNDPASNVVLELRTEVVTPLEVAPTDTPVVRMTFGEPKPTEVSVTASDGRPFDVLTIQADPSVGVTVRPAPGTTTSPAGRKTKPSHPRPVATGSSRYLMTITPKADVPVGQTVATVTVTTNVAKAEAIPIHAVLVVVGRVHVVPDELQVVPGAEVPVLHVKVSKRAGAPFEVLGVESSDADFTPTTTTVTGGQEYDVAVRYTGKPGRGLVSSRITVKTNEPGQAAIVIPLTGRL